MRPRADEVMNTVMWTFDEQILPALQEGTLPKSLALTVSNLLRHVQLRMEREGPALVADNAEVREVLADVAGYIRALKPAPDSLTVQLAAVEEAAKPVAVNGYVGLTTLTEEAQRLRSVLDGALKALQEHRRTLGATAEYQAVRDRIRAYLNHQLERESAWIRDAFTVARR